MWSLDASISAANTKTLAVSSSIKASGEQKASLEEELMQAQSDRSSAKTAVSEAASPREKQAADFAALTLMPTFWQLMAESKSEVKKKLRRKLKSRMKKEVRRKDCRSSKENR